jgi:hypothetical protein
MRLEEKEGERKSSYKKMSLNEMSPQRAIPFSVSWISFQCGSRNLSFKSIFANDTKFFHLPAFVPQKRAFREKVFQLDFFVLFLSYGDIKIYHDECLLNRKSIPMSFCLRLRLGKCFWGCFHFYP